MTGFSQSVLTNGLVAYYPFNGNANEAAGKGSNGIVVNAVLTQDRFANANQSYLFDGATTWIQTTNYWPVLGTNSVSVSCWINYNGLSNPDDNSIMNWGGNDIFGSRFQFRLTSGDSGGSPTLCLDCVGTASRANTSIPTGRWTHVAVVKPQNGGLNDTVFYVNGKKVQTYPDSDTNLKFNFTSTESFTVGRGQFHDYYAPSGSSRIFNGQIDDIRIYNTALSSNDIGLIYASEAPTYLNIKKAVYLDSQTLKIGTNYQLQISSDLLNWTNWGAAFTATNYLWSTTNYWNVDDWNQLYFRFKTLP